MDAALDSLKDLAGTSKRLVGRLATISENRLELLLLELQEERERILRVILLALGAAVFGLLAGVGLSATVVLIFWDRAPITALIILTVFYAAVGGWLYLEFTRLQRDWKTLPGTVNQLKKDRECLEHLLA